MSKKTPTALVTLLGGPLDGRALAIDSHESRFVTMDGATYERSDQQLGDYRVYVFTTADGEALPTSQQPGTVDENILQRDLDNLAAAEKKAAKK